MCVIMAQELRSRPGTDTDQDPRRHGYAYMCILNDRKTSEAIRVVGRYTLACIEMVCYCYDVKNGGETGVSLYVASLSSRKAYYICMIGNWQMVMTFFSLQ